MNIKEITVRLAKVIQEKDAEVFSMIIRDKKDKTKPSSITLNGVADLFMLEADGVILYSVKFMGEEVLRSWSKTGALETVVYYAQEYADNRAHYNKIKNSI
ncbi:hypothetical protein HOR18_gp197 [Staphylococcus phage vB_SscM-1]|uniref:Uncharacterized protein n=2 Tax=Sciuriunavirus SscM1 TaxID=2734053 RepID=A0A1X9I9U7_9CAUD|nr:hypothetical protein HOR18_gp197 [Staphylococcus phage vB_SscM-1]ANT44860.1 hypothetical protein vB_SscM-1_196 [Staphylococcus phage vB_SscM-1]ANT45062.1 hypothetical protein vB_SscM-2_195 [Staphylococcus phage vB_SscM-2]